MPVYSQQGMTNYGGVICYRLSLFQGLLHQPRFVNFLRECHRSEDCVMNDKTSCVTCCLRDLATEYWKTAPTSAGKRCKQTQSKLQQALKHLCKVIDHGKSTIPRSILCSRLTVCRQGIPRWQSQNQLRPSRPRGAIELDLQ